MSSIIHSGGISDAPSIAILGVSMKENECKQMPKGGVEPPRACAPTVLSRRRMPIPPLRHNSGKGNQDDLFTAFFRLLLLGNPRLFNEKRLHSEKPIICKNAELVFAGVGKNEPLQVEGEFACPKFIRY